MLPDTQYYACAYPEIFDAQTEWIAAQVRARGIAVVLHTGDIVDQANSQAQWQVAFDSLRRLDGVVPYMLTTGNHDIASDRSSLISEYVSPQANLCHGNEWDFFHATPPANSFMVVEVGRAQWLFVGLEYAPRDVVVDWAGHVLDEHAELPALVFTHAYLYNDGTRYDRSIKPLQPFHPDSSTLDLADGVNDGEDLWRKLIEPHENVKMVLSGHVIPDGTARSIARRSSGTFVHQVLANYQMCNMCPCAEVQGGGGYLRTLELDPLGRRIHVSTYSPFLDASLKDDENDFTLDLD